MGTVGAEAVFLLDVDNTLLDNDYVEGELRAYLERTLGAESGERYWEIFEKLRAELGYADYLGALQRYRLERPRDPDILEVSPYLIDYPFAARLYPGALDAVARLGAWGPTVILTDGDAVFQPRKVQRSGLYEASGGRVLIYIHKEQMLDDIEAKYPARHYVMFDDKLRILAAMKQGWESRLTTVWLMQGHYARDPKATEGYPPPDIRLERIADAARLGLPQLLGRNAA
jgi:FMN phosphatase YigB (HAD superfamily)